MLNSAKNRTSSDVTHVEVTSGHIKKIKSLLENANVDFSKRSFDSTERFLEYALEMLVNKKAYASAETLLVMFPFARFWVEEVFIWSDAKCVELLYRLLSHNRGRRIIDEDESIQECLSNRERRLGFGGTSYSSDEIVLMFRQTMLTFFTHKFAPANWAYYSLDPQNPSDPILRNESPPSLTFLKEQCESREKKEGESQKAEASSLERSKSKAKSKIK